MTDKQPLVGSQTPSAPPPPYSAQPGGFAAPPPPQHQYPPHPAYGTAQNTSNITVVQGQPVVSHVYIDVKPPNYFVFSLVVMLFFCFIFGLIGLLVGMQVDTAWASGDRVGARRMSSAARGWNVAGIVFGVITYVVVVIAVAASATTTGY